MPETLTYDSLLNDLRAYTERGGTIDSIVHAQLPRIVMMAENRLSRELAGSLLSVTAATNTFIVGQPIIQKPVYWRTIKSFNIGTGVGFNQRKTLYLRSYEYCRSFWPDPQVFGTPAYYADYDYDHWIVVPTPDLQYPFEILYNNYVQPLDSDNQTNTWTLHAPDVLVSACLLELDVFLKNQEMIQIRQATYDRALSSMGANDKAREQDESQDGGSVQ